jgi:hypothetical protein
MPANTPIYGFPYPLGTDPVRDGDNDIRALAEDVETVLNTQVGLWKISAQTFTAQTQVDFANVFTSGFSSYQIVFHEYTCTVSAEMIFRLRDAGGVVSLSNYDMSRLESTGTAPGDTKNAFTFVGQQNWTFSFLSASTTAGAAVSGSVNVYRPNDAAYTRYTSQISRTDNATGTLYNVTGAGMYRATTAMTGFSLIRSGAGTISGSVAVYGWNL